MTVTMTVTMTATEAAKIMSGFKTLNVEAKQFLAQLSDDIVDQEYSWQVRTWKTMLEKRLTCFLYKNAKKSGPDAFGWPRIFFAMRGEYTASDQGNDWFEYEKLYESVEDAWTAFFEVVLFQSSGVPAR